MKGVSTFKVRYYQRDKRGERLVVNFWLEKRAAAALLRARDHLDTLCPGAQLVLSDAGRTYQQQVALKKKKGKWAATPGKSWHEAGLAVDVAVEDTISSLLDVLRHRSDNVHQEREREHFRDVYRTEGRQALLEAYMGSFGWKRTVVSENWHFEYHVDTPRKDVASAIAAIGNTEGR